MNKDLDDLKSLICLFLAFLPLFLRGYFHNSNPDIFERYRDLVFATCIPGFLLFIRYKVIKPIVREDIVNPMVKVLVQCVIALCGDKEALEKLRRLGEKIIED